MREGPWSSRQGRKSGKVRVLSPSIACSGRIAYPVRAEATKHVPPGSRSLGRPAKSAAMATTIRNAALTVGCSTNRKAAESRPNNRKSMPFNLIHLMSVGFFISTYQAPSCKVVFGSMPRRSPQALITASPEHPVLVVQVAPVSKVPSKFHQIAKNEPKQT
jgi:hypothetical protein